MKTKSTKKNKFNNLKNLPKIHLACCDDDDLRPAMACVYIDNGYAVASDTHILVCYPLSLTELAPKEIKAMNGKMIHRKIWKELLGVGNVTFTEKEIVVETSNGFSTKKVCYSYAERFHSQINYPNYKSILINKKEEKEVVDIFSLRADFLKKISDILGSAYPLIIQIHNDRTAFHVTSNASEGAIAIIMPCMINNDSQSYFGNKEPEKYMSYDSIAEKIINADNVSENNTDSKK